MKRSTYLPLEAANFRVLGAARESVQGLALHGLDLGSTGPISKARSGMCYQYTR